MNRATEEEGSAFSTMALAERAALIDRLETTESVEMLRWALDAHGSRAGILTSFQDTGCVAIDHAARASLPLRVITIDTLRLHRETYELIDCIEERYGISIERYQPNPESVRRMVECHGEFLFFDSKEKQEYCCHVRKVEPNQRALSTLDVWLTGLRRDHSNERQETPRATFIEHDGRTILKLAPFADWTSAEVWQYIRSRGVPYNALYDRNFTSIGCEICSTPTMPWEEPRSGRWRWQREPGSRECGIHYTDGGGI